MADLLAMPLSTYWWDGRNMIQITGDGLFVNGVQIVEGALSVAQNTMRFRTDDGLYYDIPTDVVRRHGAGDMAKGEAEIRAVLNRCAWQLNAWLRGDWCGNWDQRLSGSPQPHVAATADNDCRRTP